MRLDARATGRSVLLCLRLEKCFERACRPAPIQISTGLAAGVAGHERNPRAAARRARVAARWLAGDHHPHGAVCQRRERRRAVIIRVRPERTHVQYEEARAGQGPAGDGGAARAGRDHAERGASSIARVFVSRGRRVSASPPSRSKARRVRRRLQETRHDDEAPPSDRRREARTTSRRPARVVRDATTRDTPMARREARGRAARPAPRFGATRGPARPTAANARISREPFRGQRTSRSR